MKHLTYADLTPDELIKNLVAMRITARAVVKTARSVNASITKCRAKQVNLPVGLPEWADAARAVAALQEESLKLKFTEIEIGRGLVSLCSYLDSKVEREAIFDALNTNRADRDTDMVRQYGRKAIYLISVLGLENSATKSDDIEIRPLKWCQTMAMMHAMQTSAEVDRAIHEKANDLFGGAFGEYRERPLIERLAGRAV